MKDSEIINLSNLKYREPGNEKKEQPQCLPKGLENKLTSRLKKAKKAYRSHSRHSRTREIETQVVPHDYSAGCDTRYPSIDKSLPPC